MKTIQTMEMGRQFFVGVVLAKPSLVVVAIADPTTQPKLHNALPLVAVRCSPVPRG